ncbi:uncharacterized protein TRIVIDRAFT_26568, partial [Trichoderma virens Gv29-8]
APRIRRLKLTHDCDEHFFYQENLELVLYSNVQEIYVACLNYPEAWYNPDVLYWPCPGENVWLID